MQADQLSWFPQDAGLSAHGISWASQDIRASWSPYVQGQRGTVALGVGDRKGPGLGLPRMGGLVGRLVGPSRDPSGLTPAQTSGAGFLAAPKAVEGAH